MVWRYDPIFFSNRYNAKYHLKAFRSIAEALSGYTEKCVISFLDIYPKNKKNMDDLLSYDLSDSDYGICKRIKQYSKRKSYQNWKLC